MLLKPRRSFITDSRLALTAASFAAQSIRIPIPRVAPYALEDLYITVRFTMANAITSGIVGYGIMNVLKRIQLGNIPNSEGKPSNLVDVSGAALLQFVWNEGLSMDRSNAAALFATNVPNYITSGVYQITYRVPMAHPFITDGLRPKCLLPIWTFNQDPILQLDFAAAAEMSGQADPFSAATVEVWTQQREMPSSAIDAINAAGGFISWDLLETVYNPAGSLSNTGVKFAIPTPGSYTGLLIHMLKGGTTLVPVDYSGNVTAGSETEWQLRGAGKDIIESWRMKYLQILNDQSKAGCGPTLGNAAGSSYVQNANQAMANFGGAISTGLAVQSPSSVFLDFASDGNTDIRELGSLLDTKLYADRGLSVEIVGNLTTAAASTYANTFGIVGRRFFGDLASFKSLV